MNVTNRLFLLVAVALLPAIAIQAYNEFDLRRSREREVRELALRQARLAASEMSQILDGVRSLLTAVAEVPAVRSFDAPTCSAYLADLQPKVPHLTTIAALDLAGRIRCRQAEAPATLRLADRPYFRDALATGGFVVGIYTLSRASGRPALPMALPLKDAAGAAIGVLVAGLDLTWLNGHLRERATSPGGSVTIADRNGVILARQPLPEQFVGTRIPDSFQPLVRAIEPGTLEVKSQDGTRRMLGYMPIGVQPENIYVSAGLSSAASFEAVERATVRGIALILVGLLLALGMASLAARRFVLRPVGMLLAAAQRWQAGDYGARSGLSPREGEFGTLASAFERMVQDIARRESLLRLSEARLRAVIECLPFDLWVCDRDGRYVLQNSASRVNWGDRVGLCPQDTDSTPEVIERWMQRNGRALAGETIRGRSTYVIHGEERHVEDVLAPIESGGEILGYVGVNIDVTERHRAEERQRLLLRELSHRVKNTLATVQVIANRSLSGERTLEEARDVLVERLRALATTHDLITASGWQGASLRAIAEAELKPYGPRAELVGEELVLAPRAAQTMGLLLHELATNAAKHGALAAAQGRVSLAWTRHADARGDRLHLEWRERCGQGVAAPARAGFGRTLIEGIVAHELKGEARLHFPPDGAVYVLEAPWAEIAAATSAA